jgi:hypothetical protein
VPHHLHPNAVMSRHASATRPVVGVSAEEVNLL